MYGMSPKIQTTPDDPLDHVRAICLGPNEPRHDRVLLVWYKIQAIGGFPIDAAEFLDSASHPPGDATLRNKQEEAVDVTTGGKAFGSGKTENVLLLKPPRTLMLIRHIIQH
ncbi:uncharacterized [Tachysurus ichikawai]